MFRRRDDWAARMAAGSRGRGGEWTVPGALVDHPAPAAKATAWASSIQDGVDPLVLVRALDGEREVLVAGPAVSLVDGSGAAGAQAEIAVAEWRQNWLRMWKRSELPGKLLEFFDRLSAAETAEEVCEVVASSALRIVGGYDAAVLLARREANAEAGIPEHVFSEHSRLSRAGLIAGEDLSLLVGNAPAGLALSHQVSHVAHVPLGRVGVLFVAERRSERIFERDEWEVLGALADQGERALQRVWRLQSAQELVLSDPLTGLANRRQMEVVMRHAWAGAQRGEGLAVLMLDLDHFKQVNDTHGHQVGDQVLCIVADALRQEARGADAVVRYGGDEFLVIMPRGDMAGVRALAARLRRRLEGWVGFTVGAACHHPALATADDLIRAADDALYAERLQSRNRHVGGAGQEALSA